MGEKYVIRDEYGRIIGSAERQLSSYEQGQRFAEGAVGFALILYVLSPLIKVMILIVAIPCVFLLPLIFAGIGFWLSHTLGQAIGIAAILLSSAATCIMLINIVARIRLQVAEQTRVMRIEFRRGLNWKRATWGDWFIYALYILSWLFGAIGAAAGLVIILPVVN